MTGTAWGVHSQLCLVMELPASRQIADLAQQASFSAICLVNQCISEQAQAPHARLPQTFDFRLSEIWREYEFEGHLSMTFPVIDHDGLIIHVAMGACLSSHGQADHEGRLDLK